MKVTWEREIERDKKRGRERISLKDEDSLSRFSFKKQNVSLQNPQL